MAKKYKGPDKLALDAAAAKAAGMSYGRWKAMQDNPIVVKNVEEIPEGWRICQHCKKPFKPNQYGTKQIYCELSCQRQANRERNTVNGKNQEYYRRYKEKQLARKEGAENG